MNVHNNEHLQCESCFILKMNIATIWVRVRSELLRRVSRNLCSPCLHDIMRLVVVAVYFKPVSVDSVARTLFLRMYLSQLYLNMRPFHIRFFLHILVSIEILLGYFLRLSSKDMMSLMLYSYASKSEHDIRLYITHVYYLVVLLILVELLRSPLRVEPLFQPLL